MYKGAIPVRQVPNAAMGAAVTSNGQGAVNTTKVTNQIAGDNELHITLVVGAADVTDVIIFPMASDTTTTIKAGVTFTADGFPSFAGFVKYFNFNSTNIAGVRIETDDVTNFQQSLKFLKKDVTGKDKTVTRSLNKYRVPVGNGYSETIELDRSDLTFVVMPDLQFSLSKVKANSTIDLYFQVEGADSSRDLSPVENAII